MPRYAVKLSYIGHAFDGWQSQPSGLGAQDELERALAAIGEPVRVVGAGRTDAGVHARAQVAHFDLSKEWSPRRLILALNAHLSDAISVMDCAEVDETFHARRSAVAREYRYFIVNSSTCRPYLKPYVLWLKGSHYDWTPALRAVRMLEGTHDFGAFCRAVDRPEETTRTIHLARLHRRGSLLVLRVVGNAFLTNMIRIAVGNLVELAAGRRDEEWFASLLRGGERTDSAQTAAASGLFFWRASYDRRIDWAGGSEYMV